MRPGVVASLALLGLAAAVAPAFGAAIAVCGVSGCSGGGFGRSTDPPLTLTLLALTGLAAALPLLAYAVWCRSARVALGAAAAGLVVAVVAGGVVGADWRGCPRNVSHETCQAERGL